MQLFVRPCSIQGSTLTLSDPEAITQLTRILRAKKGYQCVIQEQWIRYTIMCEIISKQYIIGTIVSEDKAPVDDGRIHPLTVLVGLPNKMNKIELILQKLTEIGIDEIYVVPMRRSVITDISHHKSDRLQKIIIEAVEQSRSWNVPSFGLLTRDQVYDRYSPHHTAYCHMYTAQTHHIDDNISSDAKPSTLIIGPEWWFDSVELDSLHARWYHHITLPTNILRTETASICAGYQLRLRHHS